MMLPPSERSSNCTLHVTGIPLCACIIIALTLHSALPPRPSSSLDNTKIPPYRRHSLSIPTAAFQVSASPRVVLHLQAVAVGKEGVCVRACVCVPWSWASSYECGGHPKQLATAFGDSEVGRRREGARDVSSHIRCAVIATTPTRIDLDRSCALHVNQRHLLRRSRTASQTPHSRKHTRTHAHTHTHTLTHTHIHTWASRQSCSYHFSRLSFRASYTTDTATRYSP